MWQAIQFETKEEREKWIEENINKYRFNRVNFETKEHLKYLLQYQEL